MAKQDTPSEKPRFHFEGFESPRFTQVPDQLFDQLMPELSESELKVLLYVVRRTFGFGKDRDAISLNQMIDGITTRDGRVLDRGTGLSRSSVRRGISGLEEKGIIVVRKIRSEEGDYDTNVYSLRFRADQIETGVVPKENHPAERVVPNRNDPGVKLNPGVGRNSNPQETVQETDQRDREFESSTGIHQDFDEVGARMLLLPYVEDFAREFADQAPLRSSVTRMVNLYRRSGLDEDRFIDAMYQARVRTKEYTASIKAQAVGDGPFKRKPKMAYMFSILTDLIGAKVED